MQGNLTVTSEYRKPGIVRLRIRNDYSIPVPIFVNSLWLGTFERLPSKRNKPEILNLKDPFEAKAAWKTRQTQFNPGASALLEVTYAAEAEKFPLSLVVDLWAGHLIYGPGNVTYQELSQAVHLLEVNEAEWKRYKGKTKTS